MPTTFRMTSSRKKCSRRKWTGCARSSSVSRAQQPRAGPGSRSRASWLPINQWISDGELHEGVLIGLLDDGIRFVPELAPLVAEITAAPPVLIEDRPGVDPAVAIGQRWAAAAG